MSTRFPVALADDWDQGSEVDQGLFEDAKPANKPQAPVEPPADAPPALPKQVVGLRGVVRLSYYLYPTKEQVELTYNFRVNESCDRPERLEQPHSCSFKGDATVETHVLGQLAKWNGGQCLLQVKVPNIPFALEYIESPEGVVTIKVPSLGPVQESWESQCSFTSEPNFSVKTMGEPEVWINKGLNKAKEAIEALSLQTSKSYETETAFTATPDGEDDDIARAEVTVEGAIITQIIPPAPVQTAQQTPTK